MPLRLKSILKPAAVHVLFLAAVSFAVGATTFFVDGIDGDDGNSGDSVSRAWKSLTKVNAATFHPGDKILFRAGGEWMGTLVPRGSGDSNTPIVIDRYGEGSDPKLTGQGNVPFVLGLDNQEYWEINHIEISNYSSSGPKAIRGVLIHAADQGKLHHIYLRDLFVHAVNANASYTNDGDLAAKSYGGIVTLIDGDKKPTAWDDLRIENCRISDCAPTGITMLTSWMNGHKDYDQKTWLASEHVVVRGCTIEDIARNGLVIRACAAPLVEHNLFRRCGLSGSGNACFPFHCDDAVFQFNESCFTKFNPGDSDASGFDCDYNCRRTVYQYNYSHDNDGGFMVLCVDGKRGFNEDSIVRFNISENDGGNLIRVSGPVKRAKIYNNTLFISARAVNQKPGESLRIIYHKSWDGWSDDVAFYNNIVVNENAGASYEEGKSTANRYEHNLFYGVHPDSEPSDAHKITADPRLKRTGQAGQGPVAAFEAYSLGRGSPAIGAAMPSGFVRETNFLGHRLGTPGESSDLGALPFAESAK